MPPQEKVPAADGDQEAFDKVVDGGFANAGYVEEEGGKKTKKEESNNNNNNNNEGEKVVDVPFEFDDLLPYVGEFGLYQKMLFLMMIPFAFFVAFVYFSQIFITLTPEQHWCWIPELANLTREERIAIGIPKTEEGVDRCHMYAVNYTEVLLHGLNTSDPEWPTIPCRNGWEYNYTEVPYASIASEQNWVCENAALPTIAQSIFFGGAILGGLIFGWIADRQGRVVALLGTNLVGFAAGVATAFCNSFWAFCFCRFLVGMAYDNCFTMMYILVLEYVGPKWRTFVANMSIAIFFTFAACILPWIAWFVADWRMLCHVTSIPLALAILTPWFVPESARWLVSQGKIDKAIHILRKFERINGTKVEESIYQRFKDSCLKIQKQEENDRSYSVIDLFRTPRLRHTTLLLIVVWMAISLVFDGHVRNVGSLGLNVFLTFTIASFTEFPADTFLTFTLDVWGRRWLACGSMVISGIFSLLATAVPLGVASASLAIVGRFAVNISYNIGLQYAAELLPTVVRAQGVALIHIMGYVASIIAPFVVYLANVSVSLPLLILGVLGVIGGFLCLFLPETLDQELPQTLQDGERFGMGQKLLDFPCVKKPSPEKPQKGDFKRSFARSSMRASVRGEIRSSMIARSSVRKSVRAGDQA